MSVWKTQEVLDTLKCIPELNEVIIAGNGEDFVTQQLHATVKNSAYEIWIRGFVTDGVSLTKDDNVDVEMVEVTGGFSDGDIPQDAVFIIAHAKAMAALVTMGHQVVRSLAPYF